MPEEKRTKRDPLSSIELTREDYILFSFAKEFGWTPQQVRELPFSLLLKFVKMLNEYYELKQKASKGQKTGNVHMTEEEKNKKRERLEQIYG